MKNFLLDQRSITFLISLLIASGLWLLIKLSGDFNTEHKVRLKFQNFPIDKVLINKPDSVLQIETNNNGFDVLGQFLFSRNKSLDIDFKQARFLKTTNDKQTYFILCSSLKHTIDQEFKSAEQVLDIYPDSLVFIFEKLASKNIKIEPDLVLSFNPRFKQYSPLEYSPDSILFFGPTSLLKSITSIPTKAFNLKNISADIDTLLALNLPSNKLFANEDRIRLKLDVEEYTETKISLPIQIFGNKNAQYKIFPAEAKITYQVALKDYANINPNAFELRAIPDSLELGKLTLKLQKQPLNIIVSNIHPATAEYIILK